VHCQVDSLFQERLLYLLGEESFALDGVQRNVSNPISFRLDEHDVDGGSIRQLANQGRDVFSLPAS
jgi:hypothetical protein